MISGWQRGEKLYIGRQLWYQQETKASAYALQLNTPVSPLLPNGHGGHPAQGVAIDIMLTRPCFILYSGSAACFICCD
jgi:hypothetical protein